MGATDRVQMRSSQAIVTRSTLLTWINAANEAHRCPVSSVRDEEAAGSNPATPTMSQGVRHFRNRCPGGAE
jgi:hypothetical protein